MTQTRTVHWIGSQIKSDIQHLFPFFLTWGSSPHWTRDSSFTRCLDLRQRRDTIGRTPLDEWSARRRDLYLTTQNTHNRQTDMPPVGFEPTISAGERPQIHAWDCAAIGTDFCPIYIPLFRFLQGTDRDIENKFSPPAESYVISRFRCGVNEMFVLLWCYAE
jgi:hypothetical protein